MSTKKIEEMNVLVVDDEEKICELIKIFLESAFPFHSVVTAPNAIQATQKFLNQEFDLIIIDHVMPGKLGIEYIQHLRSSIKFNRMKIILISGYLQQEDVLGAMEMGVKNIIVKPFTRQQIVGQVAELLKITPDGSERSDQ
ncbi:MAG: response regulator [Bdellovibrionales bacterium]|nr:response regulator [Bdellovibrionales bacterium]